MGASALLPQPFAPPAQRDAARGPLTDLTFCSRSECRCFLLPPPPEQSQRAEAGEEERECGGSLWGQDWGQF
jgi:hypothetical protein